MIYNWFHTTKIKIYVSLVHSILMLHICVIALSMKICMNVYGWYQTLRMINCNEYWNHIYVQYIGLVYSHQNCMLLYLFDKWYNYMINIDIGGWCDLVYSTTNNHNYTQLATILYDLFNHWKLHFVITSYW